MYHDEYGRIWEGPFPFTIEMIRIHAPRDIGIYQLLYPNDDSFQVAYVGRATGSTIFQRLATHYHRSHNWAISRLNQPEVFKFTFYKCDEITAKQIESFITRMKKPPFNDREEHKYLIPNITVH